MNTSNILKGLPAAFGAAATFLVTQTTLSVSVKDGIYVGLVFLATLFPGISLPAAPVQDFTKPPTTPAA